MVGRLTVGEAARELGVTPSRVRHMIGQGRLRASKRPRAHAGGDEWAIEADELERVRERKPGRPATR